MTWNPSLLIISRPSHTISSLRSLYFFHTCVTYITASSDQIYYTYKLRVVDSRESGRWNNTSNYYRTIHPWLLILFPFRIFINLACVELYPLVTLLHFILISVMAQYVGKPQETIQYTFKQQWLKYEEQFRGYP